VVTGVLKQAKDGLLVKALDGGGVHEIIDVLTLKPARDALTYQEDDGTVKPLSIGQKGMLRTLKIFANYSQAYGSPIEDWTVITIKDFDDFRCSEACMIATEKDNTIPSPIPAPTHKKKDLLSDFKKEIETDASLFNVLKDPKQWDLWQCSTLAQA